MASQAITFQSLKKEAESGKFHPVYFLHGEECYFIDEAVKLYENIVPADMKDFNMYSLYATQVPTEEIVAICRRFPIMSERQVVIVREVQSMGKRELAKLIPYFEKPSPSTVLVLVMRGEKLDSKPVLAALKEGGATIFESKTVYESGLAPFIVSIVKEKGLTIETAGIELLTEHIGANLAKLSNEIDKLAMILGRNSQITPEAIQLNIGISKDYNNRELIDSLATRNFAKALKIVDYFKRNPKPNPTVLTGAAIFSFFSNLLIAQFARDKSPSGLMKALGLYSQGMLRPYTAATSRYNAWQTIEIISLIRDFDCKIKGNGSRQPEYALLEELIYRIFCAKGNIAL